VLVWLGVGPDSFVARSTPTGERVPTEGYTEGFSERR
jgi:hypothetical protein